MISLDKSIIVALRMERHGRCFNVVTITSVNFHRMYAPTNTVTCYFQSVTFKGIWYVIRQILWLQRASHLLNRSAIETQLLPLVEREKERENERVNKMTGAEARLYSRLI